MGDTLQINDDHYVAQNQLAEGYIETGDLPKAADVLVRIIDADPDNYRAYNNLGLVAWEKEDWDDAFRLFRKALTIRADYNDALVNLFDAAVKLRSVQETLPWFDKALAIDWNLDEVRLNFCGTFIA